MRVQVVLHLSVLIRATSGFQSLRLNPIRSVVKCNHVGSRSSYIVRHQSAASLKSTATEEDGKGQSVSSATFSLIKSIVGTGVLALPSGLAVMSDSPAAIFPAIGLILGLGGLSAYTFYLIGRLCHANGSKDLTGIWELEVGTNSSWILSLATFTYCMGAALTYSIVLGDTFQALAASVGVSGVWGTRHAAILAVSLLALFPLSQLQSLTALAPVSLVGVIGTVVTCVFMATRYFDSAYRFPNGAFLPTLAPHVLPSFGARTSKGSPISSLILGSMSATAFLSHFAAPDFLNLLKKGPSRLKEYGRLTLQAFSGVALINIAILSFGFLTFGGNSAGVILNNYSNLDVGASICRLLMAISVIGGYPFLLRACNKSLVNLLWKDGEVTVRTSQRISATILAVITGLSLLLRNAGLVVSFNGAVMGSAITYIFPALLLLKSKQGGRFERLTSPMLIVFGVLVALMGGSVSLMNAFAPNLLH